ncbi:MAG: flagellar hook-length control protein FliK [Deltaproteobacteria bacterium]|nr:flagellar hook-length control protein FliK [Deltaproteobacteria bacterium]MBW1928479.1 flagellar hook-length control protein FliK [Deltaproteobacteria bacterium]MBW2024186.1 flagellar hook-length control protein FliK [Deltaproteobacteria bacterium]MBW2124889.1 flagellar hook-length control protein FliK [Deltaproteobacteria bacterium]RLB21269.1 MAG: hypothetical protein DRG76_09390 [Deltaproteobacteria bacterium]
MTGNVLLNLFQDLSGPAFDTQTSEGTQIRKRLFQDLFKKLIAGEHEKNKAAMVAPRNCQTRKGHRREDLMAMLMEVGRLFPNPIKIPSASGNTLRTLLEGLGLKAKDVTAAIAKATDKEGYIHLDKLGRLLQILTKGAPKAQAGLAMDRSQLPQLALVFMRLGSEPGKVREVIEKYANGKSVLGAERIVAMMNHLFPGLEIDVADGVHLLHKLGFSLAPQGLDELLKDPRISKTWAALVDENDKAANTQAVKKFLAQLLREKGLLPEKIKEILESIHVKDLKPEAMSASKNPNVSPKKVEDLASKVVFETRDNTHLSRLRDRILAGLKVDSGEQWDRLTKGFAEVVKNLKEIQSKGEIPELVRGLSESQEAHLKEVALLVDQKRRLLREKEASVLGVFEKVMGEQGKRIVGPMGMRFLPLETWSKVVEHLQWMIKAGQQESRLLLHPPELGHMDLKVMVKHGHIQVQLATEQHWVKEVVEADLNALRHQLTQMGFVVDKLEVMVGLGNSGFQGTAYREGGTDGSSFGSRQSSVSEEGFQGREPDNISVFRDECQVNILV